MRTAEGAPGRVGRLLWLERHREAVGGHIANIGVHGKSVELKLEKLWNRNITITTRLVDAVTTAMLLESVLAGKLLPKRLITHEFVLRHRSRGASPPSE